MDFSDLSNSILPTNNQATMSSIDFNDETQVSQLCELMEAIKENNFPQIAFISIISIIAVPAKRPVVKFKLPFNINNSDNDPAPGPWTEASIK